MPATALLHELGFLEGGQAVVSAAWGLVEVCAALALAAALTRRSALAASGAHGAPALTGLLLVALPVGASGQQVPDTAFSPKVPTPAYAAGAGPLVAIDAAHVNFHTMEGRYASFATLLRNDGYRVRSNEAPFTRETLARNDVLVISNAMHEQSADDFAPLPNLSAFTEGEVRAVEAWVADGGALLLIADHMPIAGHAEALAAAFGVRFHNGFVFTADGEGRITFRRSDGSLVAGTATDGRGAGERVDSVTTFTGQAFRLDAGVDGEALLVLSEGHTLWLPSVAWEFSDSTPRIQAAGLLQGALLRHGRGRVAVFGEAAMFGAQLAGPGRTPMGMNHSSAAQNPLFALNVLHWLTEASSGGR